MLSVFEIAPALEGTAHHDARFDWVATDTRGELAGALFVALRGERFDGHDFVAEAARAGAAAALVERAWADRNPEAGLPLLVVGDTRRALGRLAAAWRSRFDIPIVGITGSNGKTTVKEMCAAILRAWCRRTGQGDDAVLATAGNFNNDIGLPLTLLRLRAQHRAAVVEMGMNRPGEIAGLTRLAQPTVTLITNAQRAHLQGMGTLADIAREKGTIHTAGADSAVAVINADDPHADYWREQCHGRPVCSFGLDAAADVTAQARLKAFGAELELTTAQGSAHFELAIPGEHNVRNALAATAACLAAGAVLSDVVEGLRSYRGTQGRLQRKRARHGALLIDDSYNANPDSARAAIDVLAALPGRKILVLGDMGEIGRTSAQVHDEVGGYAKSMGLDALYALGEMSAVAARNFGEGGQHFDDVDELVAALESALDEHCAVLVKGSRSMRMERVVEALESPGGAHAA